MKIDVDETWKNLSPDAKKLCMNYIEFGKRLNLFLLLLCNAFIMDSGPIGSIILLYCGWKFYDKFEALSNDPLMQIADLMYHYSIKD